MWSWLFTGILGLQPAAAPVETYEITDCADFSGDWIGSCEVLGGPESVDLTQQSLTIEQHRCAYFVIDGQQVALASVKTHSTSAAAGKVRSTKHYRWNPSRQEIEVSGQASFVGSRVSDDDARYFLSGRMTRIGASLREEWRLDAVEGESTTILCNYRRGGRP